jgi:hypothetical protein
MYFFLISLCLPENFELRADLATGSDLSDFRSTVLQLQDRYLPYHEGTKTWPGDTGMYVSVQSNKALEQLQTSEFFPLPLFIPQPKYHQTLKMSIKRSCL